MSRAITVLFAVALISFSCATSPKTAAGPQQGGAAPQASEGQRIQQSQELANKAREKIDQNLNAEGLDLANQAIGLDPENGEAYLQQARAYRNFNKKAKALSSFDLALKYSTNTGNVQINMAQYFRDTGETDKAREIFEQVLAKSPNDAWANREFAYLYRDRLGDYDKALSHFAVAVAQGNDDPWIYNDISVTYEKKGDMEKASEFLNKAKERVDAGQGDQWIKGQVAERSARLKP